MFLSAPPAGSQTKTPPASPRQAPAATRPAATRPAPPAQPKAPPAENVTPDWVARQIDARDTGKDGRFDVTMRLFDRQGRQRERAMQLTTLGAADSRGERILVKFTAPNDIKGTGLLVWEHPKEEDERFLYLPALGRVRRIAAAEEQDSFVGSDFSYEDIGGRELDDYTYSFVNPDATWTAPDRRTHAVWMLESKARDPKATFPRIVSLVRKDNFVVVVADVYNRRDEREKRFQVNRLEQIDGIWTAMEVAMGNLLQKTRTELVINNVRYNTGLTEADFTRRVLEQAAP